MNMKFLKLLMVFSISLFVCSCSDDDNNDNVEPLYEIVPNISMCHAGELSEIEKQKVLVYVNKIRDAHKLPHVEYNTKKDLQAQRAALIGAANAELSHTPSTDVHCYTSEGYQGCSNGNLSLWGSSTSNWPKSDIHINEWMTEINSEDIGHRRWILDPFLSSISFGRVIGTPKRGEYKYVSSAVMIVKNEAEADISDLKEEFFAYPQGVYDSKLFDPKSFLSFSVLYDNTNKSKNALVDFSEAEISVSVGSQNLIVKDISFDNDWYGLPNSLQWKVEGLSKNVIYEVKITGVKMESETKDFEYTFSYK